ncbi:hypothetical protein JYU34_008147 [Plutella xylostella]|uniref:Oxysterol-binding protein n=2 Tax=Plutella xylostella TaxID=51655 RepID=A0ABQ7QNT7_PLUXY|nr:hypothetical protein JYU34_008147 [Plutella xylostella]
MELGGKVHILCPDTGYQADVDFKLRSFLGGSEQTNSISGRIKRGKDTVATIEGYWDARIDIKEKQSGEESTLLDVGILKQHRLNRYLVKEAQQTPTESQRLWARVSAAIRNEDQIAATEEKTIIEEGQRTRARSQLSPWVPRIFYKDQNVIAPNGIAEQGWRYHHKNVSPWQAEEIIEYEDDFVIKSLTKGGGGSLDRIRSSLEQKQALHAERSDSDSREDTARRSKSTRTIKQSLLAIDTALREQAAAIEKLSKNVETLNENQRTVSMTRHSMSGDTSAYPWQILGGFIVAIILQAIVNWLFPSK